MGGLSVAVAGELDEEEEEEEEEEVVRPLSLGMYMASRLIASNFFHIRRGIREQHKLLVGFQF
jgi:hypothetical protein